MKQSAIAKILRIPFIVLIILLPGLFVAGQVKFTTVASSQEIGRGDYIQVEFVVENARQIDRLTPPEFPGFHVVQGPIQSSGMSVVNGNTSQYQAISFVLQPEKSGKFVLEGATASVDGKQMKSNPVTIVVNSSGSSSGAGNRRNNISHFPTTPGPDESGDDPNIDREYIVKPGENIKEKIRKNLFVKVQVDKTTCYVGEPVVATYKLYSRLRSESRVVKRPSLNGFSVYDMVDPNTDAALVEKVNGRPFTVHIIRKTQLVPLQAGTIDLDPVEVDNTVHFLKKTNQPSSHSGNTLRDLFDQLVDDDALGEWFDENVLLDTKPLAITIKPLPEENKPANYNGAVGNFSIKVALVSRNITAQDEATLRVVVRGSGNLPVINAPQVSWPSGIDAYDPTTKEEVDKTTAPMSGSKTFDYVFSPKTQGHYTIPAVSFSYFDPSAHSYKTISSDSMDFEAGAASKRAATAPAPPRSDSDSSILSRIRAGGLNNFVQQYLEWLFAVVILALVAFYLWRQNVRLKRAEKKRESVPNPVVRVGEQVVATGLPPLPRPDPLLRTKQLFEASDYQGFYRELNRAVWRSVTEKLDLPASELNKYNIARQLQAKGWDVDTTRSLEIILNECEMNLYTPAYDAYNMQQLLRQSELLFEKLV